MACEHRRRRHHCQNLYQKNLDIHQRSTFMPMLCSRTTIREVTLPRPAAFSYDPLSPRNGCIQVNKRNTTAARRHVSHRFSVTLKSNTSPANDAALCAKFPKLKRLFSSKSIPSPNITTPAADETSAPSAFSSKSRTRFGKGYSAHCSRNLRNGNERCEFINIDDMDPPLPVIKKMPLPAGDSLWRRRSGGVVLKSLQLQPTHVPMHHPQGPGLTTV